MVRYNSKRGAQTVAQGGGLLGEIENSRFLSQTRIFYILMKTVVLLDTSTELCFC